MKLTLIAASLAFVLLPPAPAAAQQQQQQQQQPSQNPTAAQKSSAASGGSATRGSVRVNQGQSRSDKFKSLDLMVIFVPTDTDSDGAISVVEFEAVPLVQPDGTSAR